MDMVISGSGQIAAGEYDKVKISGSGQMNGFVRCGSCHVSGSASGEEIVCKNELAISGSSRFSKNVKAGRVSVSGTLHGDGDIVVSETMSCSGRTESEGSIKCGTLSVAGQLSAAGDVEAEMIKIDGSVNCGGLMNAEEITLEFKAGMKIGSIGGSKIVIYRHSGPAKKLRLPLLSSFIKNSGSGGRVCVRDSIEGDSIAVEGVVAQRVSGRVVAIGDECEIELVQYSETLEVSPDAKIGRTEKI